MFSLTSDQQALLGEAERAGAELREVAAAGVAGRVNRALVRSLGERGLLERLVPDGGQTSAFGLCLMRQGLARICTEAESALAVQGLGLLPIHRSGQAEAQKRWIPPLIRGEGVAAFALTEPGAGSDVASLALVAERDGGGYRLSGQKTYISNAPEADVYAVFARTTQGAGSRGITAFAVSGDSPGLGGQPLSLIGSHPIGSLQFDGVYVEAGSVLGEVDGGFRVAMHTLDLFRPSVGAFAVGMAEAALAVATEWAKRREAFGRPISEFQAVSHQLAEMAVRLEAARLLVYRAAAALDGGESERVTGLSAVAKLFATEAAQFVVDSSIQVLGARGLEEGSQLAHLYHLVRAPRIYEGTSEIQRSIIARELLGGRL